MKKIILATVVLLTLSACATTLKKEQYSRGDANESEFNKQAAQCEMESHRSKNSGGYGPGSTMEMVSKRNSYNEVFDACMRSKGFSKN